jgi:hypothetical protein
MSLTKLAVHQPPSSISFNAGKLTKPWIKNLDLGVLKKLTVQQIRYVLISLKRDRRITYESLVNYLGSEVSRTTIRRAIRYHYGRKWKAMQRIPLLKVNACQRLSWC